MLLLLACADETDSGKPAETPTGWADPFEWALDAASPCPATPPEGDATGELAAAMDQDFPFGIPDDRFAGTVKSDDTRLSWYPGAIADLTAIPCLGRNHVARADAALASDHPLTTIVADGAGIVDQAITVGGSFDTPTLADALAALGAEDVDTSAVPEDVQAAAVKVLVAAAEAIPMRDAAIASMMPDGKINHAFDDGASFWLTSVGDSLDPNDPDYHDLYLGSADLYAAGARVAQAVDELDLAASTADFHFQADTPYGAVILNGGADDTYDTTATLLVIDTSGDDTWLGPSGATASQDNPVSVAIDLAGDDVYSYDGTDSGVDGVLPDDADGRYYESEINGPYSRSNFVRQGAGVLGVGILVDRAGNDHYGSLRRSQGYAQFGVGILYDAGGDDVYEAEAGAQGAACVGVAALVDISGADRYKLWNSGQGFGWVSSSGLLWDGAGDDAYELVPHDPILFYSGQLAGVANSNIGQGAGFGMRRDDTGEHLSGGIALLRDLAGDDVYIGATYVQGAGYMLGTGVFADGAGADEYYGEFYAQGTGVHLGIGLFLEDAGDDKYNPGTEPASSMLGLGHDSGVGLLVDAAGDDAYNGSDRSIGAGKCHGLGLLVDRAGDDSYTLPIERGIGWATDYDTEPGSCGDDTDVATWGLFVDLDGTDTYDKPYDAILGDDKLWLTYDPDGNGAMQLSGGIDTTGGDTFAR